MMESPEARPLVSVPWVFTRQGLAILAFVTAVAATYLITDVAYLAGALLLVGLGTRVWARLAFARVTYSRKTSRSRAFAGDELALESVLANPRLLPLPWIEVWEQLPEALQPEGVVERSYSEPQRVWTTRGLALWPYQRARWRRRLHCQRRGVFQMGTVRMRTGDPFGFFERQRTLPQDDLQVLVYPRVVPLRRLALPLHHPSLDVASPNSPVADPTRTAAIRDYRPDDPQRFIHWPTTARRGSLQVRVLEPSSSLHVSLLLDVRGFSFGVYHDELLELTLSALASIGVYLQTQGAPLAFFANTDPPVLAPPGASVPHLQYVLEALARLQPSHASGLMPWAFDGLPRGNSVVLAATDVAPDLWQSIGRLEESGFHVLLLLASGEDRRRLPSRTPVIRITPGCDLAARLEGRG